MDLRANQPGFGEWRCRASHGKHGAELLPGADLASFESALRTGTARARAATFLVVSVDRLPAPEVRAVVDSFIAAGHTPRLCLAVSGAGLATLESTKVDPDHVGWMLDGVDADTPLTHLIDDRIEAIRFSRDFVSSAARNMRVGCALESMLSLAHELGLCTLGFDVVPAGASVTGRHDFDYVAAPPAPETLPPRARARVARHELSVSR